MFIIEISERIQRFNFILSNHTSGHLKIIQFTLHWKFKSFISNIQHKINIFRETATRYAIFLENVLKIILSNDLIPKKMKEPENVILAQ